MTEAIDYSQSSLDESLCSFSKGLPDDCVEYTISIIDSTLEETEIRQRLRGVQSSATALTKKLLKGYIWQRDSLNLNITQYNGSSILYGKSQYGDSVEDEWLIVYIIRELSKIHPNIWIRVVDTDGQFLLIEAANTLPNWLNPEVADFRVWINCGKLLIIPIEARDRQSPKGKPTQLTLENACKFIQQKQSELLHSPLIEAEAFYRLEKYPQQIQKSLHHALITIPRKVAYIIRHDESYISPAIEAFYLRDPIALRPLQTLNKDTLLFAPTDLITVSVKFTKVGYAQLCSQQFTAPPVWTETGQSQGAAQAGIETGMKLTSGFEMLVADQQNKDKRQVREIRMLLEDLESGQDQLPTNSEIQKWPKSQDDELWLDINFESFEQELEGKQKKQSPRSSKGFGDRGAQENLRKIVTRFEDFLNDDTAGVDGAEFLDDMDYDDTEDEDVSLDEAQFAAMMKEMMGMSTSEADAVNAIRSPKCHGKPESTVSSSTHEPSKLSIRDDSGKTGPAQHVNSPISKMPTGDSCSGSDEEFDIRKNMEGMEHELRNAGVLRLNPEAPLREANQQHKMIDDHSRRPEPYEVAGSTPTEDFDEEIEIDMNLAKNMLESFKGQAGMAGPGGNLFGLMGVRMPRDEDPHTPTRNSGNTNSIMPGREQ
ncbi:hypothetical protein G7Y79_00016g041230 [Physcia stellaris]|nr:hypothetical protein G7Y79_00016g041230 [Physcia stellaris]